MNDILSILTISLRLVIPAGTEEINNEEFRGRDDIEEVVFAPGSKCTRIGDRAFAYCANLKRVELPESLRSIGSNAFARCVSLEQADVPQGVTTVESYAFADCHMLTDATLPSDCKELGEQIFAGCDSLQTITIKRLDPPAFECGSNLMGDEFGAYAPYCRVALRVPRESVTLYREAPGWSVIENIDVAE